MREAIAGNATADRDRSVPEPRSHRLKTAIEQSQALNNRPAPAISAPVLPIHDMLRAVQERERDVQDRTRDREGPERCPLPSNCSPPFWTDRR